jgi:hypothetical protein
MQDAGGHVPAGPQLEPVAAGQLRDPVVAARRELRQALGDLGPGRLRVQPEEGDPELSEMAVELRREVVRLRLALLAEGSGVVVPE